MLELKACATTIQLETWVLRELVPWPQPEPLVRCHGMNASFGSGTLGKTQPEVLAMHYGLKVKRNEDRMNRFPM